MTAALCMMGGRAVRPTAGFEISSTGMALQGADEFDGEAGAPPDSRFWDYERGAGGWGNEEQQEYTDSRENSRLDGSGNLVIQAHQGSDSITSARLVSRGRVDIGFGLLEARIRMPEGPGIHSAFWLLGTNILSVGWPQCGEIDVMEMVKDSTDYHNAIHGPMLSQPEEVWKQSADGPAGVNLADDFHVYQILREPGLIKIGLDGRLVGEYRRDTIMPSADWVFDAPMYVVLNIAVGGEWPGPVTVGTQFPATMLVDWIRYWV